MVAAAWIASGTLTSCAAASIFDSILDIQRRIDEERR
jgi:hypothetical protein